MNEKEERRLCELWLNDPLVNPETGHDIERNGPTYSRWKEKCKIIGLSNKPINKCKMTYRKCQEWKKNPEINPETGRKIKINGPLYRKIEKQCKLIQEKHIELLGEYVKPNNNGMVPTVLSKGSYYVIREYENRKIWGKLNKPAKVTILHYFTDTWDYKNNHYKPIFINIKRKDGKKISQINKNIKKKDINNIGKKENTLEKKLLLRSQDNKSKYMVDKIFDIFISKS